MHFSAIVNYNKSLIFADHSFQASMCYHARSSIYLKIGFFKHCLRSIDLAVEHCPSSGVEHLHNNRKKCLKLHNSARHRHGCLRAWTQVVICVESSPKLPLFFIDAWHWFHLILGEIANPFPPSSSTKYARLCVSEEDDAKWTKSI